MKNLVVNIPMLNDATSFYRAAYPLGDLRELCPKLTTLAMNTCSEATLRSCDGAFFQRPFAPEHRAAVQMCVEVGCPVWVDYDDLLSAIPTDNPTYWKYMNQAVQNDVNWILENASVITVSTPFLAQQLSKKTKKRILVAPNALDMRLKFANERAAGERRKTIAWRGSQTHLKDVFRYSRAIIHVSRDPANKDWFWHFIGDSLALITDSMPHHQTFVTRAMGPIEFHRHLQALSPSALMVPLDDSVFNRCKSNIAWIEATVAGAAAIVPEWEEWDRPGTLKYKNEEEFAKLLYAVINGEVDVAAMSQKSWEWIQENLTLRKANEVRAQALCELFQCDRKDLGY